MKDIHNAIKLLKQYIKGKPTMKETLIESIQTTFDFLNELESENYNLKCENAELKTDFKETKYNLNCKDKIIETVMKENKELKEKLK